VGKLKKGHIARDLRNEGRTMNTKRNRISNNIRLAVLGRYSWCVPAVTLAAALSLMSHAGWQGIAISAFAQEQEAAPAQGARTTAAQTNLMPPERELAMKIKAPFTLVAVGDLILRTPIAQIADSAFQSLVKHMRDADVTFANQEGPMIDQDNYTGPMTGAPKSALADIKAMGIDIVGTANNHSMDAGEKGMLETIRLLNEGGIVHAGTGRNLQEARAPRFLNTPKGTIGLVSVYGIDPYSNPALSTQSGATYQQGARGGSPGLNPLHLIPFFVVTADQMEQLRKIRDSVYARRGEVFAPIPPVPANEPKDRVGLFGQSYKVGPKPGDVTYEMNPGDLREIARSIRNGKEYVDFMIATAHIHEGNYAFQTYTYDNDTPDFLVDFAHKMIDAGADAFIGHGVHTIRGVEIYKGKPIFYGTNTFIYQYQNSLPQNPGGQLTDAEATMSPGAFAGERVVQPERMEALLTESRFENGRLVEVRVYPADLGQDYTRPFSRLGVPMTPSPEMAQRVLEKLQRLSKPFGTKIDIENGVGVIRISEQQTSKGDVGTTGTTRR